MNLTVFFTDTGVPSTGLTPTIDVWTSAGTQVITAATMTEVAGGFYLYDFSAYDETQDYLIRADGGVSLSDTDRYIAGTNEVGQVTSQLSVQDNNLQLILGLVQSNFRMTGQTFDGNGNLTAAVIAIYPTGTDADNQTNQIASYTVAATYGLAGQVIDYKVTDDST